MWTWPTVSHTGGFGLECSELFSLSHREARNKAEPAFVGLGWAGLERTIKKDPETGWHLLEFISKLMSESGFSASAQLTFWTRQFFVVVVVVGGGVLCIIGCLEASLASVYQKPVASSSWSVTVKKASRHCQMSPEGQSGLQWRTTGVEFRSSSI